MEIFAKIATSLDGKIALYNGESKWISCEKSRQYVHELRSKSDAILTSSTTAIKDNARLNVRLDGFDKKQPIRVLLDSYLKTPINFNIFDNDNAGQTIVFCSKFADFEKKQLLIKNNVKIYEINCKEDALNLVEACEILKSLGIKNLMIEAGGKLLRSFINLGLVSKILWFRAPIIIGNDAIAAFGNWGFDKIEKAIKFNLLEIEKIGSDILETYSIMEK